MRKINFSQDSAEKCPIKRTYSVRLGNGSTHVFKAKKDAIAFLSATADFLENQIRALNHICAALYQLFSDFWFYTDVLPGCGHVGYRVHERKIRQEFNFFHEMRDQLFARSFFRSASTLSFSWTVKLVKSLTEIIVCLVSIIHRKSLSAHIYSLAVYTQDLTRIEETVNTYAHATAYSIDYYSRQPLDLFTYNKRLA